MLEVYLRSLQDTRIATAIREGDVWFPWIEAAHVLALTVVIGSIAFVDLRLIGWMSRDRSVAATTRDSLPITWAAFAAALITGGLLFSSNATTYAHNVFFQIKLLLIALAGLNMVTYHFLLAREAHAWLTPAATPLRARVVGAVSLGLWVGVVICGRWIGFTIDLLP